MRYQKDTRALELLSPNCMGVLIGAIHTRGPIAPALAMSTGSMTWSQIWMRDASPTTAKTTA